MSWESVAALTATGGTVWVIIRSVRWLVHKFDAFEQIALKSLVALDLIINEFHVNGGRIVDQSNPSTATLKDLMLDQRASLNDLRKISINQTETLLAQLKLQK